MSPSHALHMVDAIEARVTELASMVRRAKRLEKLATVWVIEQRIEELHWVLREVFCVTPVAVQLEPLKEAQQPPPPAAPPPAKRRGRPPKVVTIRIGA